VNWFICQKLLVQEVSSNYELELLPNRPLESEVVLKWWKQRHQGNTWGFLFSNKKRNINNWTHNSTLYPWSTNFQQRSRLKYSTMQSIDWLVWLGRSKSFFSQQNLPGLERFHLVLSHTLDQYIPSPFEKKIQGSSQSFLRLAIQNCEVYPHCLEDELDSWDSEPVVEILTIFQASVSVQWKESSSSWPKPKIVMMPSWP